MSRFVSSSPHVPDVLWQQGMPLRRRLSRKRRYTMIALLMVLSAIIGGYWYITDANRVRIKAEEYLSRITGAKVTVGAANLSIFEGLRLDNVQILVGAGSPDREDARLFAAQSFRLRVDLKRLLQGKLEAASILAIGPKVRLVEDVDTGRWNYDLLQRRAPTTGKAPSTPEVPKLPEIRLRNASVEYGRLEAGKYTRTGTMAIEAQLIPDANGSAYQFRVQSRGESELVGPRIVGAYDLATRKVEARLHNFEFDRDMRTMLPDQVQQWWQLHQLAGRIDVPQLSFTTGSSGGGFTAKVALDGVTMVVLPEEAQSADEIWRRHELGKMFGLLAATGGNPTGWIERTRWLIEPQPITLNNAQGVFTFTNTGIELSEVIGRIEGMAVRIDGRIGGYSPGAELDLRISSLPGENLVLPAEIRWINSTPPAARETYDHLRPRGAASMQIQLTRATRGGRVDVNGEINILDGGFTFDRFPYPVERATGRIIFGRDRKLNVDSLELAGLQGYGVAGGPNEKSPVRIDGLITPLTSDPGVEIRISGKGISTEPILMRSFPPVTRKALSSLDAPGKGEFPKFVGDFVCSVTRAPGPKQPWNTDVDIDVREGEGAIVAFPYHLSGVHGRVKVREGYVEIEKATMERDGAKLVIDGRVSWRDERDHSPRSGEPTIRPKLRITATNAPIDDNLLAALPETHRTWMERLGLTGRFDLDGMVEPQQNPSTGKTETGFGFVVSLRDATLWPKDGTFVVNKINGELDLGPQSMQIRQLTGRRNEADVAVRGAVAWPDNNATIDLQAEGTNLALDAPLYRILPAAGQSGWDVVSPEGTVDATLKFTGNPAEPGKLDYRIALQPRKLAVKPSVFPTRFTDVTGNVVITPARVDMNDLIARRGESRVSFGGTGDLKAGLWDMKLSADRLTVDPELVAAMPAALGELVKSSAMGGTYDVLFRKLRFENRPDPSQASTAATRGSNGPTGNLDFDVRLETRDGSLTAGVPLTELLAWADISGGSRDGKIGSLAGTINAESFKLGGRRLEHFQANLAKQAGSAVVSLSDLRCGFSGGEIAGRVDWAWPESGPSRYGMSLVLRDADVRELVADAAPQLQGRLTASLAIEGGWDDPTSRRGRGDVVVEGREMYRIPLLLGLLQITNLSLPISKPFERGTISYGLEGNKLTMETIELTAEQMKMSGSGEIDFGDKQVRMTFVTDSTAWPKLPIVGELLRGARHELLQIHVRGSLEEPKVSAGSMNTITTTIEEVFRGDDRPPEQRGKKK